MKTVVLYTNTFFAALRTTESYIRDIIERADIQIIAPNFLVVEIFIHKDVILRKSRLQESELYELLTLTLQKIKLVSEESIDLANLIEAYRLCADVDEKDASFVALALEYNALLWTRDRVLKEGLERKGFDRFFNGI